MPLPPSLSLATTTSSFMRWQYPHRSKSGHTADPQKTRENKHSPLKLTIILNLHIYTCASYHTISHHITSHHIIPHHTQSHHITSHHTTLNHITSHRITTHHITSHHTTPHHTQSHHISHHITQHTAVVAYNPFWYAAVAAIAHIRRLPARPTTRRSTRRTTNTQR
jgi:hypothetical protein